MRSAIAMGRPESWIFNSSSSRFCPGRSGRLVTGRPARAARYLAPPKGLPQARRQLAWAEGVIGSTISWLTNYHRAVPMACRIQVVDVNVAVDPSAAVGVPTRGLHDYDELKPGGDQRFSIEVRAELLSLIETRLAPGRATARQLLGLEHARRLVRVAESRIWYALASISRDGIELTGAAIELDEGLDPVVRIEASITVPSGLWRVTHGSTLPSVLSGAVWRNWLPIAPREMAGAA
jgi:hypothetical protein